jgi:EmrB/QacA subfamily drug resistance transporter
MTLTVAVLGFFMITFDAVVVNVALPSIRHNLGGGLSGLQWVVDGYTLLFAALLLTAGSLSDRVGAGRAFGGGLVLFLLASLGCGLAPNLSMLVAARFLQGTGAAVMMPASMALISQAYADPMARARAVGVWAMGGSVASCSGPVLGGLLTLASWRLIFLLNLPVGAVALLGLGRSAASPQRPARIDWPGQTLAIIAMGGLTYGAIEAGDVGLRALRVEVALGLAVAALVGFVMSQARGREPMMPLQLVTNPVVARSLVIGFAFMVGYYGLPFVFSLYFQQQRGLSALATGVLFLPMMLVGAALTPLSARIVEQAGHRLPIVGGLLLMAGGLVVLGLLPASTPLGVLSALMILVGAGGPLVMPPTMAVLLNGVHGHMAGRASGVFNTSRQVGGALAIAVFGGLLSSRRDFQSGVRTSLVIAAAVAAAAAVTALRLRTAPPERTVA